MIRAQDGFSLIELLIVISIISILGAISYPTYKTFRLESRRSDAHSAVINYKGLITEYLVLKNKATFTTADRTEMKTNHALPEKSKGGMYDLDVVVTGSTYKIVATASSKQAEDTNCAKIIIDDQGNRSSEKSGDNASTGCW